MNRKRSYTRWILAVVLLLAALAGLSWANYQFSLNNPGGNDFLVHWVGTRSFLFDGLSPYSDEVAIRIQTTVYGRPAIAGEHELRVAYPLYSIALFFPFALVKDYTLARALWMTVLEVGLLLTSLLAIRMVGWRPGFSGWVMFILFSLFWYHGVRPLVNGNAVILVALMITGGILALRAGEEELAGVLFAFSSIKPQLVVLVLLYVLIWGINRRKWNLIGWLVGTIFLLTAAAALLLPDWILQNLREVLRYPGYNPPGTLGAAFTEWFPAIGPRLSIVIAVVLGGILLLEWWLARRAEYRGFVWTVCLTLVISQWIGIQTDPGNFIILLPALVLVFAIWQERWPRGGRILTMASMQVLMVGLWALFVGTVEQSYQAIQSPLMFLPLPGFLLVTLYWVRWWAVRPPKVWHELLVPAGRG